MMKRYIVLLMIVCSVSATAQDIKKVKVTELADIIRNAKKPILINFWATWCKPCVAELPYFLEEVKDHKKDNLQILLVSMDFAEAFPKDIQAFAKKRKLDAPICWLDESNADYFCPVIDSSWSGAIPATLLINPATGFRHFTEGELKHEELKGILKRMFSH